MFAFVGLGNPGAQYQQHRHNIGFMVIDAIADKYHCSFKKAQQGMLAQIKINGETILLYKPMLYMNKSGNALASLHRFYRLSLDNIFIFHDEIELDMAKIRIKKGGGNAGHNGLKDISQQLGNDYHRIRIGVSRPKFGDVSHYVLSNFTNEEQLMMDKICDFFAHHSDLLLNYHRSNIMQHYQSFMVSHNA